MHLVFRNVNYAFRSLIAGFVSGMVPTVNRPSRNGPVIRAVGCMTVTYENPRERVLFSEGRDANPFFHLFESLWMLAGRNDVAPLKYYVDTIDQFSDDGLVFNAAYGNRWRQHFGYDQLVPIAKELANNGESRRMVIAIWDGNKDLDYALAGGKDVPCNTQVMLEVDDGRLNMTVTNRSNDMILGMFGANLVHFSFLQEYMASRIGVELGVYNQFSNNLHAYTEKPYKWDPVKWIGHAHETRTMHDKPQIEYADSVEDRTVHGGVLPGVPLVQHPDVFDREVCKFIDNPFQEWREPFLNTVAKPMMQAFKHHKARQYDLCHEANCRIQAEDWRWASALWTQRRRTMWEAKQDKENNPYRSQEDKRAAETSANEG